MALTPAFFWRAGALSGAAAVLLGAFGAHGLQARFAATPKLGTTWQTAAQYHLLHSGVLLVAASQNKPLASRLLLAGMALFSGSLYALVLLAPNLKVLGAIAPVGGLLLTAGWLALLA